MEQDLKVIIEQMNSSNAAEDEDNPMVKVVKILNAHADSLNWIDRNTALLKQKVDEVGKQTEQRRREQERSFRLAFDQ
ncbi:Nuclear pore glycoprotein p62 [Geodia barretti]|uniref:Nuclear pore glycoprotein p62 n=1 Tax=Geodia barretti TaxID=519541 RepID=A0AA35X331_GEOBA|nr:Nuclear pore glycoprotein p62 [Geodia barretti]